MRAPNRLSREKSPYLLQHAANPVDWFPWGEEAFARSRAEDKPIFLSIGYSTCHWCHVMERESFENPLVAELLNAHFVCVKVDREERPDVDRVYMTAMQAMRMGGGWPLNVFLNTKLEPFWGGTYFPPTSRRGMPGMDEILPRIHAAWLDQREAINRGGAEILELVSSMAAPGEGEATHAELARQCADALARSYDAAEGGFGTSPKFPSTVNLNFLWRWWACAPEAPEAPQVREDAKAMALRQLEAMRAGGIHDHVGGGFHRYSTDREWLVPHFEKMLYDQALILDAYLDGYLVTRDERWAEVARGIVTYVLRDFTSQDGAFLCGEDADSEGEEGLFYVWTPEQLVAALGVESARVVAEHWDLTPQGNFEKGASILHEVREPLAEAAAVLAAARETLLAARSQRVRPHLDDKVLAAWNGMMIAALARAARVLHEPAWAAAAARAAEFAWAVLRDEASGALYRRWREGEAAGAGQLDDYANLSRGCLELFAVTHEARWLARATQLADAMLEHLWDDEHGACFESPADASGVSVRMKDGFDGAETAGNSMAALVLLRLAALLDRTDLRLKADRTLDYYASRLAGSAWAMPQLVAAMLQAAAPTRHVVVAGEASPERDALLAVYDSALRPFEDLIVVNEASRAGLAALVPFAASLPARDGRATAYVCVNRACRLPVHNPAELAEQLNTMGERS